MSRLIQEASQGRFLEDHLRLSSDVDVISESKVSAEPCMYTSKYKAPSGFFPTTKRGNVERAIPISISGVIKRGFEEDSFTFCRISTTLKIDLKSIPELGSIWIIGLLIGVLLRGVRTMEGCFKVGLLLFSFLKSRRRSDESCGTSV